MSKRKSQILIEYIRNIILRRGTANNFWPKILLVITYISNLLFIFLLNGLGFYKTFTRLPLQLIHLKILKFTVYIFIYKEKKKAKSAK